MSKYPALFAELFRRGYTDDEVAKIARLNIIRVLEEAEQVYMYIPVGAHCTT